MKKALVVLVFHFFQVFIPCYGQINPFDFKVDSKTIKDALAEPDPELKKQKIKYLITNDFIKNEDYDLISSDSTSYFFLNDLEMGLLSYSVMELIYERQSNIQIRQTRGPSKYVLDIVLNETCGYVASLINTYRFGRIWQRSNSFTQGLRTTDMYIYRYFDEIKTQFLSDTFYVSIDSLYTLLNLYLNQSSSLYDPELTFSTLIFQTESTKEWELFTKFGEKLFMERLNIEKYSGIFLSQAPLYAYFFKVFHSKHFDLEETSQFIQTSINNKLKQDEFASYLGTLIIYYKPELIYKYLEIFWDDISKDTFYSSFSKSNPYNSILKKMNLYLVGYNDCASIQLDVPTGEFK